MAKKLPPEIQAIISASDAGHHATTVKLVEAYLIDHPESQKAWVDLGHALGQLARYREAEQAFEKAIELIGDGPVDPIFGEIGHLYRARGLMEQAAQWYRKQIEADPSDVAGYLFLGNLQRQLGDSEASIETLEKAIRCEFGCMEEAYYSLGLSLRNVGRMRDAKAAFEQAVALDDRFVMAKSALKDVSRCC